MPARTTRQQARQRAIQVFMDSLDRIIPADESVPLKGRLFRDWEDQVAELRRALIPTLLEERSALSDDARGFVFNADISAVVQFLDVGTQVLGLR